MRTAICLLICCVFVHICAASEMILIPAGEAIIGSTVYKDEGPPRKVHVPAFYIDKYEVTAREYRQFDPGYRVLPGHEDEPALVNWYQAMAYAKWAGKRLPTEIEWEKAARGTDGREYPWGNEFDPSKCQNWKSNTGGVVNVGSYPEGVSPYGVHDMAGNAWEWTSSPYLPYPGNSDKWPENGKYWRVIKGGRTDFSARCAYRRFALPIGIEAPVSFRCVKDVGVTREDSATNLLEDLPNPTYVPPPSPVPVNICNVKLDATKVLGPTIRLNEKVAQPSMEEPAIMERLLPMLKKAGIKLIRLNILRDQDVKLTPDGEIEIINWKWADWAMNWLDRNGFQYVFELAPRPQGMPVGPGNAPPSWPADKWRRYIRKIAQHVAKRSIKPQYWEFWGEPDLGQAWDRYEVIQQYLEMYKATAQGILDVIPDAKIGGPIPSNSYLEWLEAFVEFCVQEELPIRLLTWHQYNAPPWRHEMDGVAARKILSRHAGLGDVVLGITEWNTHAGHYITNDNNFNAPYIGINFMLLQDGNIGLPTFFQLFDGWDYFEPTNERFWHRWGMITWDFHPKAAYNMYRMWNMLGDQRVKITTDNRRVWTLATKDSEDVKVLLINFSYPVNTMGVRGIIPDSRGFVGPTLGMSEDPMLVSLSDVPPVDPTVVSVSLHLDGLPPADAYLVEKYVIDRAHGNSFEYISRADLQLNSQQVVSAEESKCLSIALEPYSATLLCIRPTQKPSVYLETTNSNIPEYVAGQTVNVKFCLVNKSRKRIYVDSVSVSGDDVVMNPGKQNIEREAGPGERKDYEYYGQAPDVLFGQQFHVLARVKYHFSREKETRECVLPLTFRVIPKIEADFFGRTVELGSVASSWRIAVKNNTDREVFIKIKGHIPVPDFHLDQAEFFRLSPKSETILCAGVKQKTESTNSPPIITKFPMFLECEGQTLALGTATLSVPLSVHRISDVKADGNLEEWEARQWISIPGPVKGRQTHEGDATAKFAVGWDNKALYIAFDVYDDKFLQNFSGVQMWKGDSVQVAIDGMRDPGGNDGYDLNDYEFGIAQGPQGPQSFCWYGVLGMTRGPNPNIEFGIKTEGNRRTYEMAVPWTSIQALKPESGRVFGLLTIANDSDEPGDAEKRGYLEWGGEIVSRKYTSGFYGARLVE